MERKRWHPQIIPCLLALLLIFLFAGCAPTPDNGQVEAAIRASLTEEASPPVLDFSELQIPHRSAGKAGAVLWTEDKGIQRNYSIEYDREARAFAVAGFTTSQRGEDGTYYFVPEDENLSLTEYAKYFSFSADPGEEFMLLYAGQGENLAELRNKFETEKLTNLSAERLREFELCDLGGDVLILLVPRYEGLSVWVNEVAYTHGDHMEHGQELARFGDKPVYIFCDFDEKWPEYEIHVSVDDGGVFFLTSAEWLESIRPD